MPGHPDSPYETAFFTDVHLPPDFRSSVLHCRQHVFEFELAKSERADGLQAVEIQLVSKG